ncbi:hypothetical protein [Gryllotalpicola sp.]|nr:hypothetical protein [Gryllotalpicola sp.]
MLDSMVGSEPAYVSEALRYAADLTAGAVVVIADRDIPVRPLPIL